MTYTKLNPSEEITSFFICSSIYKECKSVHLYESMKDEVDTQYILDHIKKSHRKFYFPTKDPYQNQKTDVIIVPGRKFDSYMNRKGRGQGYYDRFVSKINSLEQNKKASDRGFSLKIGLCYESQMVNQLRSKPHDISMDMVITEKGIYKKRGLGINQVPFSYFITQW